MKNSVVFRSALYLVTPFYYGIITWASLLGGCSGEQTRSLNTAHCTPSRVSKYLWVIFSRSVCMTCIVLVLHKMARGGQHHTAFSNTLLPTPPKIIRIPQSHGVLERKGLWNILSYYQVIMWLQLRLAFSLILKRLSVIFASNSFFSSLNKTRLVFKGAI